MSSHPETMGWMFQAALSFCAPCLVLSVSAQRPSKYWSCPAVDDSLLCTGLGGGVGAMTPQNREDSRVSGPIFVRLAGNVLGGHPANSKHIWKRWVGVLFRWGFPGGGNCWFQGFVYFSILIEKFRPRWLVSNIFQIFNPTWDNDPISRASFSWGVGTIETSSWNLIFDLEISASKLTTRKQWIDMV